jgi:oleandomycin transport system ATP-binding protein
MRRRLDLAISLVGAPRVLFLDEPTTGLDPRSRADLWAVVRKVADNGSTVLLTTQYLDEADRLADEIVVMNHGRVVAAGTPSALKSAAGGRTLNLTPIDPNDLSTAADVVASFTGAIPNVDVPACQVTVLLTDPGVAPAVLRRLDEAGIMVAELSVRMPNLDDVFFALTGPPHGASTPIRKVVR